MKLIPVLVVAAIVAIFVGCYAYNIIGGSTVLAREPAASGGAGSATQPMAGVHTEALTHTVKDIDGKDYDLNQLKGKAVLVVNVASRCGFTPQYEGLEKLYTKYQDKGLIIIGFPSNDFGGQEPGTADEIKQFCSSKYAVTFPIMSKVVVKGHDKTTVYKDLTENTAEFKGEIAWNFTKFLIARDGQTILARFPSKVTPEDPAVVTAVEKALGQ